MQVCERDRSRSNNFTEKIHHFKLHPMPPITRTSIRRPISQVLVRKDGGLKGGKDLMITAETIIHLIHQETSGLIPSKVHLLLGTSRISHFLSSTHEYLFNTHLQMQVRERDGLRSNNFTEKLQHFKLHPLLPITRTSIRRPICQVPVRKDGGLKGGKDLKIIAVGFL
ncbi:hypothetical protein CDAR_304921 [Caerostris darwini]|uniref:Uncharacterized protein n=1 Tax=Caerostris darwini TaxID=1538125 RepID=A0AAV4Q7W1_9ARAC|nr:hypothetical protein CDAR_304921 [Caerostris darwini]